MTRINLIEPLEISDKHLLAEYRELPRIVNAVTQNKALIKDIPEEFCFGKGHVKFFYDKLFFLAYRYEKICSELAYRGFSLNPVYNSYNMIDRIKTSGYSGDVLFEISEKDFELSRKKLIEKYKSNPSVYKWTKRKMPDYYNLNEGKFY